MMTTVATIMGLLPVFLGTGTGSDLTSRIAAPMVGGMISAVLLTLIVLPGVFYLWKQSQLKQFPPTSPVLSNKTFADPPDAAARAQHP